MSVETRVHAPIWNAGNRQVMIPSNSLNYFFREKIQDKLNFFQNQFNLFEFVSLNEDAEFRINTIQGDFPIWQKDTDCSAKPMGRQNITSRKISQEKIRLYTEWCYKEVYNTIFKRLMKWTADGGHDLDQLSVLTAPMQREYLVQATRGLMNVLLLGGLFDTTDAALKENAQDDVLVDFQAEANSLTGLLAKVKTRNAQYSHMYDPTILPQSLTNGTIGMSIVDLFNELVGKAPSDLSDLIYEGSAVDDFNGNTVEPVMVVSSNFLQILFRELKDAADNPFSNKDLLSAIERRPFTYMGKTIFVYHIFGVPVVPLKSFCAYNKYLKNDFYFAALTTTRNMQIATNFGPIGSGEDGPTIGVTFEQEASIAQGKKGMVYWDSHAICGVDIANPNLFVSTWRDYPLV